MNTDAIEYWKTLVSLEQKAQESYDKTILSLSGGALGVSFAFIRDVVGTDPVKCPEFLFVAWSCWAVSVTVVLWSFFSSSMALRKTLEHVSNGGKEDRSYRGGVADKITAVLNVGAGVLFLVGVITIGIFVVKNLKVME